MSVSVPSANIKPQRILRRPIIAHDPKVCGIYSAADPDCRCPGCRAEWQLGITAEQKAVASQEKRRTSTKE
jgi:hypothetical protein